MALKTNSNDIEDHKLRMSVRAVLDNKTRSSDVPLIEFFSLLLTDRKTLEPFVKELAIHLPLNVEHRHLKRVNSKGRLQVLLQQCDDNSTFDVSLLEEIFCKNKALSSINVLDGNIQRVVVPALVPESRQQFEFCKQIWPVHFHENKVLESLLRGTYFNHKQLMAIENNMLHAFKGGHRQQTPISDFCSARFSTIVEPKNNRVLASSAFVQKRPVAPPAMHAVMSVINSVAENQLRCTSSETEIDAYLCTGYDCYVDKEPCLMCCMALLHSRIRIVFIGCSNSSGAFTKHLLHCNKQLNHSFLVFLCDIVDNVL